MLEVGETCRCPLQEVTGGQLVTASLVYCTVDSGVPPQCHLCCPTPLPGARQAEGPRSRRALLVSRQSLYGKFPKNYVFFHTSELSHTCSKNPTLPQVAKPKRMARKFGLMRLNPNVEKKRLWDVGANVARWTKLSSAGSTRIFDKKIGLSRLNSIF